MSIHETVADPATDAGSGCDPVMEERRIRPAINDEIMYRLDRQDVVLNEIRHSLGLHLALEAETKPALDELLAIWRGSRVMVPVLLGFASVIAALYGAGAWIKDHIK